MSSKMSNRFICYSKIYFLLKFLNSLSISLNMILNTLLVNSICNYKDICLVNYGIKTLIVGLQVPSLDV